jgi:hypothetical protein
MFVIWVLERYFKARRLECYLSGGIYIQMRTIRDMGKWGSNEREEKYQGGDFVKVLNEGLNNLM